MLGHRCMRETGQADVCVVPESKRTSKMQVAMCAGESEGPGPNTVVIISIARPSTRGGPVVADGHHKRLPIWLHEVACH